MFTTTANLISNIMIIKYIFCLIFICFGVDFITIEIMKQIVNISMWHYEQPLNRFTSVEHISDRLT